MFNWAKTTERVSRLEDGMVELRNDVGTMVSKIDKLVEGISSTDGRAAERAQSVKVELREETERKTKERNGFMHLAIGVLGAIALIVAALTGPYIQKLETTTIGQATATKDISSVREVLAQQGASIGRNDAALDLSREKNHLQDQEIFDMARDNAAMKQAFADHHISIVR